MSDNPLSVNLPSALRPPTPRFAGSAQDLWAVGRSGVALHGNGTSWTPATQGFTAAPPSIFKLACAGGEAWAPDPLGGQIWHYASGMWTISLPASYDLVRANPQMFDVAATANAIWISGSDGVVLRRQR